MVLGPAVVRDFGPQHGIVKKNEPPVAGPAHVQFNLGNLKLDGPREGCGGVLRRLGGRASVGDQAKGGRAGGHSGISVARAAWHGVGAAVVEHREGEGSSPVRLGALPPSW